MFIKILPLSGVEPISWASFSFKLSPAPPIPWAILHKSTWSVSWGHWVSREPVVASCWAIPDSSLKARWGRLGPVMATLNLEDKEPWTLFFMLMSSGFRRQEIRGWTDQMASGSLPYSHHTYPPSSGFSDCEHTGVGVTRRIESKWPSVNAGTRS